MRKRATATVSSCSSGSPPFGRFRFLSYGIYHRLSSRRSDCRPACRILRRSDWIGSDRRQDLFGVGFGGILCLRELDGALLSDERTRALARACDNGRRLCPCRAAAAGGLQPGTPPRGDELRLCGAAGALPSTRQDARALDPFSPSGGTRREPGGTARAQVNLGFCRPPRASVGGMPGLACIAYVKGRAVVFSRGRTPAKISTGTPAPLTVFLSISHNFARALPASEVVYNTQYIVFVLLFSPFGVVEAAGSSPVTQTK